MKLNWNTEIYTYFLGASFIILGIYSILNSISDNYIICFSIAGLLNVLADFVDGGQDIHERAATLREKQAMFIGFRVLSPLILRGLSIIIIVVIPIQLQPLNISPAVSQHIANTTMLVSLGLIFVLKSK